MKSRQKNRPKMKLILASSSLYRQNLLKRLARPFELQAPGVDEEKLKQQVQDPCVLAKQLALAKANAVAGKKKNEGNGFLVIGSDQVIIFQGQVLGQPGSEQKARAQLQALAGQSHILYTAVALVGCSRDGTLIEELFGVQALMVMRKLENPEIDSYLNEDQPFDCAGSYKLEKGGIRLFAKIQTDDFTTIEGLPLIELETRLRLLNR